LVDRTRPGIKVERAKAVQADIAEIAFVDLERHHRAAVAVLRQRVELAGAAVVAVAIDEMRTFDAPGRRGHVRPPSLMTRRYYARAGLPVQSPRAFQARTGIACHAVLT